MCLRTPSLRPFSSLLQSAIPSPTQQAILQSTTHGLAVNPHLLSQGVNVHGQHRADGDLAVEQRV